MDQGFLIAFHHVPEEIEAWLNARAVRATLPRVVTDISKDEDDWFSKCGVSVRVEWDDRFAHSLGIVIQQDLSVRIGSNYFESILDMGSGATTQHAV